MDNELKTLSIAEIEAIASEVYYTSDVLRELAKHININKVTVSYGKTRHHVYYSDNGVLLGASVTTNKRGGFVIRGKDGMTTIKADNGGWYALDPCMNAKYFEAARAIATAFSKGNPAQALTKLGQDANHCSICGAILTDELSCSRGIGPECWKKIGVRQLYVRWLKGEDKNEADR